MTFVVWVQEKGFSMSGSSFDNVLFVGSEFNDINAIEVEFINSKFLG